MPIKNSLALKRGLLGLAIGWTLAIAILCLIKFNDLPSLVFSVSSIDKYVHITLHFVFTLLWGLYLQQQSNKTELRKISLIVLISAIYGGLIEILQETFTTTRHADILDVLANLTGALMALLLFVLIKKQKKRTIDR